MQVRINDSGFNKYKNALKELDSKQIHVGLFSSVGDEVLTKGIVNEFGTTATAYNSVVIPERSFIRSTYNKQYKKVTEKINKIFVSILKGDYNIINKLKLIGLEQETEIKKTITDMKIPPNARFTIIKKGFDNPLIETGEMRSKISYKVKNK